MKVKNIFLTALITLFAFAKVCAASNACEENPSKALQFASALMAIELSESFPFSLLSPPAGTIVQASQVCGAMVSSSLAPSKQTGYTDLTMVFKDKTCLISLQLAEDGKVGDFSAFSCTSN